MDRILLVAFFGAVGALSRYGVQMGALQLLGPTVLGTLLVNVSGSFVIGVVVGVTSDRDIFTATQRVAIAVGFLGAYTTFSTLMLDSVDRFEAGQVLAGAMNIAASVVLGLAAVYAGLHLGRAVA